MASCSTRNRYTLTQLYLEDRKQQAHLRKITDMKKRSGVDNTAPFRPLHRNRTFMKGLNEKKQEISKANDEKARKLLSIMTTKRIEPPTPIRPKKPAVRDPLLFSTPFEGKYDERISKTKGRYSARDWKKQYDEHQGHLRLRSGSAVFAPLDVGANRQRLVKANSVLNINGKKATSTSSSVILYPKVGKK